jgi:pimeloyl-ACP methyl ester carboxylesterase
MRISRHVLTLQGPVGARRVHYRRCGTGPALLMVHQSPRSSAEYSALMQQWGQHFTCIAPDTPGFGQSDPLGLPTPEIADYADALAALVSALGLAPVAAYGFHSGGIILVTALKRHPALFRALAIGGYAIWTEAEMRLFSDRYLPPLVPTPYGEHLAWLWSRMLEQSWFFPWFDQRAKARLSVAHADVPRVHAAVMEMLDAGDAYRLGYGAVLRALRDIPPPATKGPPVRITAYRSDPLCAHIDRLGAMPANWDAFVVETPADHQAASLQFLLDHRDGQEPALVEDATEGFLAVRSPGFDGLIHWAGTPGTDMLHLHPPGAELSPPRPGALAIDLPGHGLSDGWQHQPTPDEWFALVEAVRVALGARTIVWPPLPAGEPDRLYPDLAPDRFGGHLHCAWGIARASALFSPWYAADAAHAIPFDAQALKPETLARAARARLRAPAAHSWHTALSHRKGQSE